MADDGLQLFTYRKENKEMRTMQNFPAHAHTHILF